GITIIEPDDQLGLHRDGAALAAHQPNELLAFRGVGESKKVDEGDGARFGLEGGLENRRLAAIAATRPPDRLPWRDQPAAVLRRTEQRGEAGARIEAGQAEPVDGAVAPDKRRRPHVAD